MFPVVSRRFFDYLQAWTIAVRFVDDYTRSDTECFLDHMQRVAIVV